MYFSGEPNVRKKYIFHFNNWSTHCGPVMPYGNTELGLYNAYLPDGIKSLLEAMLTFHQWHSDTLTREQFHMKQVFTNLTLNKCLDITFQK